MTLQVSDCSVGRWLVEIMTSKGRELDYDEVQQKIYNLKIFK